MKEENSHQNWGFCGQENLVDFLQSALISGKPAQAYLFVGPENIGKSTLALKFASALLCQNKKEVSACGECFHCRQITNGCHPDMTVIERLSDDKTEKIKREISVEQIRDLRNKLQQTSFLSGYKLAVIPEAQYLNQNSANGLLKIMEEPLGKTVIILIADDLARLPKTIASRCQVLRFLPTPEKTIAHYLVGLGAEESNAVKLAKLSFGRPGMAVSLFKGEELLKQQNQDVQNFLSIMTLSRGRRFSLVDDLIDWQDDETLNIKSLQNLFGHWQSLLRDFLLTGSGNEALTTNLNFTAKIESNSSAMNFARIKKSLVEIEEAKKYLRRNVGSKFILENLIINL